MIDRPAVLLRFCYRMAGRCIPSSRCHEEHEGHEAFDKQNFVFFVFMVAS